MTDIEIERGVPLPASNRGGKWLALLAKMKPGDSVELDERRAASFEACIRRNGHRCTHQQTGDGKFRIWLLEAKVVKPVAVRRGAA